jgi:hypothetical protein
MKIFTVLFSIVAVATAFAPMPAGRANTKLKKAFWDTVSAKSILAGFSRDVTRLFVFWHSLSMQWDLMKCNLLLIALHLRYLRWIFSHP